jgi:chorismate mutase
MEIAELIGNYKKDRNLAPHQPERWKKLLADRRQKAQAMKLDPGFVKKIFDLIHMESIGRQE